LVLQRHLGPLRDQQQLLLVGVPPREPPVEGHEPGATAEDAVEAGAELAFPSPARIALGGLEVGVEPPEQGAEELLGRVLPLGGGVELVHEPLGMHPSSAGGARSIPARTAAGDGRGHKA
jgi:hypothetical protein